MILPGRVETPCLVIDEAAALHNLEGTVSTAGGAKRLIPHLKTHRAPWVVRMLVERGVRAFKAATAAEVEMALESGAEEVLWAYPSANRGAIERVIDAARRYPGAQVSALVESQEGLALWRQILRDTRSVRLRVDLDGGMGRTGLPIGEAALELALSLLGRGLFAGWHLYDGHIHGDRASNGAEIARIRAELDDFLNKMEAPLARADIVVGGSYSFEHWRDARYRVSPGSWIYSSARHARDLAHLGWRQAAFVLATVVSVREANFTLDAGAKAVGADLALEERFTGPGRILGMSEEHTVVQGAGVAVGERVLLTPGHACTTAYLYDEAWVRNAAGAWERRAQMGNRR
jgi:D-serine deaminase-like pyridoxal phosphate-dependent protein